MMKSAALLLLCSIAGGLPGQTALTQAQAEAVLARAKEKLAPDRRTVVFDVAVTADEDKIQLTGEVHSAALERQLVAQFQAAGATSVHSRIDSLPSRDLGQHTYGVVCVSVANLRSKPGHSQELGTQALLGMPLRLLKKQGGWYYVQTPNDYLCWTRDRVQRMTASAFDAWRRRDKVIVMATYAHVRSQPDESARPVSDVVAGGLLALAGEQNGYYQVAYPDGRTGYLKKSAAQPFGTWLKAADDHPKHILATARRFFGVPYLWGGTSTKGMDCSGFTSTVYLLNGVILPRDASQQVHVGIPIPFHDSFAQVQKGDLLFFGRKATTSSRERVTHVGISLGGSRLIHASSDVHENSLDPKAADYSPRLQQTLLHVRRVRGLGPKHGVHTLRSHPLYVAKKRTK